jgi:hypothetical protein
MRNAVLGALMLLTTACGAYTFPGESPSPTPSATGTVSGRVIVVPCAPVQPAGDSGCAQKPLQGLEIDYAGEPKSVFRTVTDSRGSYRIELPPGNYLVKLNTYMRVIKGPLKLTIAAGSTTTADYVLDSGIRVPLPQA